MIKKIYPTSKKSTYNAENIYLKPLLSKIKSPYKPYYYANFLSSFDGRIAIFNKKHSTLLTPEAIKSDVDFSLFCQLHAQADCLVTNTKYMSGLNKGYYGDILTVRNEKLKKWRKSNNLTSQKIIILSNSLKFKIPHNIEKNKEDIAILTTCGESKKLDYFKKRGYEIISSRGKNITAKFLNKYIQKNKLKSVYFIAGPNIVEQMIEQGLLDRLYYSTNLKMVGTNKYDTLIRGDFLRKKIEIYLDEMFIHKKNSQLQTIFQVYKLEK